MHAVDTEGDANSKAHLQPLQLGGLSGPDLQQRGRLPLDVSALHVHHSLHLLDLAPHGC